jgi:hypothetical protein
VTRTADDALEDELVATGFISIWHADHYRVLKLAGVEVRYTDAEGRRWGLARAVHDELGAAWGPLLELQLLAQLRQFGLSYEATAAALKVLVQEPELLHTIYTVAAVGGVDKVRTFLTAVRPDVASLFDKVVPDDDDLEDQ